eukprot:1184677-Prorocentrum_minimum.AAC.1
MSRVARSATAGLLIHGPFCHYWIQFTEQYLVGCTTPTLLNVDTLTPFAGADVSRGDWPWALMCRGGLAAELQRRVVERLREGVSGPDGVVAVPQHVLHVHDPVSSPTLRYIPTHPRS